MTRVAWVRTPQMSHAFCPVESRTLLGRIRNVNEHLNAFISIASEGNIKEQPDHSGTLASLLVAVKDNIHVKGHATTCGSPMLSKFIPNWNAQVVDALQGEGAIIVGKTNMDEFAMGSHSISGLYGPVVNPLNGERRSAGGSSGGSAVAVATGLVQVGLGSDTGGSVRLPASYCGVVGFKPSYGRISRHGLVTYASSLDTIGILASNVPLTAKVFRVLQRTGGIADMTSYQRTEPVALQSSLCGLRIGIINDHIRKDPIVEDNLANTISKLASAGGHIIRIEEDSVPAMRHALVTYYISAIMEAASCLSRYPSGGHFSTGKNFGPVVEGRLRLGRWIAHHPIGYSLLNRITAWRSALREQFAALFNGTIDVLLCPTAPTTAPLLTEVLQRGGEGGVWEEGRWEGILKSTMTNEELPELMDDLLTIPASLTGVPAISLPLHPTSGIQLMAARDHDEELLQIASLIEAKN